MATDEQKSYIIDKLVHDLDTMSSLEDEVLDLASQLDIDKLPIKASSRSSIKSTLLLSTSSSNYDNIKKLLGIAKKHLDME